MSLSKALLALSMFAVACGGSKEPAEMEPTELVTSGCTNDNDCDGGRCIAGIGSGLCTANCTSQNDCPDGTVCADTEAVNGVCLLSCSSGSECTEHLGNAYTCDTETDLSTGEDARVCIDSR